MKEYTKFPISNFRTGFDEAVEPYASQVYATSKKSEMHMKNERSIDMQGQRFGKLLVIDKLKIEGKRGLSWACKCDCGKETIAFGGHLRAGKRVSCGCQAEEKIEASGVNLLFSIYKRKSKLKSRIFNLSYDDFRILIKGDCYYCGVVPSQKIERQKTDKVQIIYNGIDRKDSSIGYVKDNCVSCCKRCNVSKSDMSYEKWIGHLKQILKFQGVAL